MRKVIALALLVSLAACTAVVSPAIADKPGETTNDLLINDRFYSGLTRIYDHKEGNICYVYHPFSSMAPASISCVPNRNW